MGTHCYLIPTFYLLQKTSWEYVFIASDRSRLIPIIFLYHKTIVHMGPPKQAEILVMVLKTRNQISLPMNVTTIITII